MNTADNICLASLMTAKTVCAISSIQILGKDSADIIKKIFKPAGKASPDLSKGQILHGYIFDGDRNIDEVVIGCEDEDVFSINCHGNPLIVENILELLKRHNVKVVQPTELLAELAYRRYGNSAIEVEAYIASVQSVSVDGVRIILHQSGRGLLQTAKRWLKELDVIEPGDIKAAARQILNDSRLADLFIKGAKIVIAGPPNSGKSTLFNFLCGREKAIVTDIAGTTRDWLAAKIRLKRIHAEIFDTAGIDENLSTASIVDAESQRQAVELVKTADLVLLVLDITKPLAGFSLPAGKTLVVFNKCDLGQAINPQGLKISARTGVGIKELVDAIECALGVADFDVRKTVCFTDRQRNILQQIVSAGDKQRIRQLITELLNGNIVV